MMKNKKKADVNNPSSKKIGVIVAALCVSLFVLIRPFVLFIVLLFRPFEYRGEHNDLYTVAVNNGFGIFGYESNGEALYDPVIEVIETDDYGRTLFFYSEYRDYSSDPQIDYGMAFVIMQKAENGFVYYYQDDCYLPYFDTNCEYETAMKKVNTAWLDALKKRNDWNQVPDESKCTKMPLAERKPEGNVDMKSYDFDVSIYPYAKANGYNGTDQGICHYFLYCNADSTGKELYYVYGISRDDDGNGGTKHSYYTYAVIVNPDKTISKNAIVEIKDPSDSHQLIKELKELNDWK